MKRKAAMLAVLVLITLYIMEAVCNPDNPTKRFIYPSAGYPLDDEMIQNPD